MPARIREVPLHRTTHLDHYRSIDHLEHEVDELSRLGRRLSARLGTGRVWMLNSTASGGGVAEMMPRVCSLLADLGVNTKWIVLDPDEPAFFRLTKTLHNMLHGEPGRADDRELFERVSREAAEGLRHLGTSDVLVVHDPQPVGIASCLRRESRPRLIWRSHVGVAERNEHTRAAWNFLAPYLEPYERLLFTSLSYVPQEYWHASGEMRPGIDPLAHKNRELRPYKLVGVLLSAGVVEGPPPPEWARFRAPVERYVNGRWEASPVPGLLFSPFVLQISRFDRLKGFQHLVPAFVSLVRNDRALRGRTRPDRVRDELERVQLVLAGPEPSGVADDPEAAEVVGELCAQVDALPPELRARVHLLQLPLVDPKENALVVNALQRAAAVVVQNSVREGFGLTVTEALWKATPVVAANVGGLAVQIRDRTDGLLVDDPRDETAVADALFEMLASPHEADAMGRSGHTRVREHFLVLDQVRRWLEEIERLIEAPRPT